MKPNPKIIAVDPGSTHSGLVYLNFELILPIVLAEKINNEQLLGWLSHTLYAEKDTDQRPALVYEDITLQQQGDLNLKESVKFIGRLLQTWSIWHQDDATHPLATAWGISRSAVRSHLVGHKTRLTDAAIRRWGKQRFGERGTTKKPGPTYALSVGSTSDMWSALAVGTTYWDRLELLNATERRKWQPHLPENIDYWNEQAKAKRQRKAERLAKAKAKQAEQVGVV